MATKRHEKQVKSKKGKVRTVESAFSKLTADKSWAILGAEKRKSNIKNQNAKLRNPDTSMILPSTGLKGRLIGTEDHGEGWG